MNDGYDRDFEDDFLLGRHAGGDMTPREEMAGRRRRDWQRDPGYYDPHSGGPGRYQRPDPDWRDRPQTRDQRPGPMTGLGPVGYQRSDERICDDVNDRLTQHGWLDATHIQVEVKDCVVYLRGEVGSRADKRLAEEIAEGVSGLQDIRNELNIVRR
jgi:hypothetical protein